MNQPVVRPYRDEVQPLTNKVLRNAYILLSLMLALSAGVASLTIASNMAPLNPWLILAFLLVTPFIVMRFTSSPLAIPLALGYGALIGFLMGPIVGLYLAQNANIVINAFAGTAIATFALSMYALTTRKDFSFLRGFFVVGIVVVLIAIVAQLLLQLPLLGLMISGAVVLLSSIGILWHTSQAVHGGETNYVVVAVGLFADIWSMFMSLLRIFGIFGGDD
jgi:modulator of FtsH protease